MKDAILLRGGKARIERQDLATACRGNARECIGRVLDVAFTAEEHQDVAGPGVEAFLDSLHRALRGRGIDGVVAHRAPAGLDRMEPPAHFHHRRVAEMRTEPRHVDGGGRHDHLEVRALGKQALDESKQEVDVEAALVRLVHDDGVGAQEQRVTLDLGKEHAVGDHAHQGTLRGAVVEAHLEADRLAEVRGKLRGNARRNAAGGDAPRLGHGDDAVDPAPGLEADLGELGGLAGTGVAADDHHLAGGKRLADPVPGLRHRQVLGVAHGGDAGGTGGTPLGAALEVALDGLQGAFGGRLAPRTGCQPGKPAAEQGPLLGRAGVDKLLE